MLISKCFNIGSIFGNCSNIGGIVGSIGDCSANVSITNTYNAGSVESMLDFVGGIIGSSRSTSCSVEDCYNVGSISGGWGSNIGSIAGSLIDTTKNCYYDNRICPLLKQIGSDNLNNLSGGLSTSDMMLATKVTFTNNNDWVFAEGMYPRIKDMEDTHSAIVGALPVVLSNNETASAVKTIFKVGSMLDIVWKSSEPSIVMIDNNEVNMTSPAKDKKVRLTVSKGGVSRSVALTISAAITGTKITNAVLIDKPTVYDYPVVIDNGGSLTINPGCSLTAKSISNLKPESLIINNTSTANAKLVITDGESAMPQVRVIQDITTGETSIENRRYQLISIPVNNIPVGSVFSVFDKAFLDRYNQATQLWERFDTSRFPVEKLRGYAVNFLEEKGRLVFDGQIDNSDAIYNLDYNIKDDGGLTLNEDFAGLNLIGNPYLGAIDVSRFEWDAADFEKTVYVWSQSGAKYLAYPTDIASEIYVALGSPSIPACQGFWVRVISSDKSDKRAVLKIPYSSINGDDNRPIYKSDNVAFVKIEVSDGRYKDDVIIVEKETCSNGFDNGYDGIKWFDGHSNRLYTKEDAFALAVNCKSKQPCLLYQ